jgi:hypothetical protein
VRFRIHTSLPPPKLLAAGPRTRVPFLPPPGKLQQAQDLCRRCGQDWRAAALSGGGPWGPLPVGAAAADADERMDDEWQAEDLAAEVCV